MLKAATSVLGRGIIMAEAMFRTLNVIGVSLADEDTFINEDLLEGIRTR
jgi:hypothetical protein